MIDWDDTEYHPAAASAIWLDGSGTRRFLLPNDLDLPAGDFHLHTAAGRQRRVDVAALAPFEVSAEEAETWATAELKDITRRLGAGLKEALLGAKPAAAGAGAATGEGNNQERPSATPGLDLLADITGTPRERFEGDYRAVGRALRDYFKDMTDATGDALSGEPEREQAARRRMRGWAETLRAHGIAAPEVQDSEAASGDDSKQRREGAAATGAEGGARSPRDDSERRP